MSLLVIVTSPSVLYMQAMFDALPHISRPKRQMNLFWLFILDVLTRGRTKKKTKTVMKGSTLRRALTL